VVSVTQDINVESRMYLIVISNTDEVNDYLWVKQQ